MTKIRITFFIQYFQSASFVGQKVRIQKKDNSEQLFCQFVILA